MGPLTDLCLPPITKDAAYLSPLSLLPSSFYFSFGLRCPLPFQLSCLRFTRPCDPHTALLLQWPVVPLSTRSRAKYISSCSFTTTNKDHQVTSSTQSDPAAPGPFAAPLENQPCIRQIRAISGPRAWLEAAARCDCDIELGNLPKCPSV